MSKRLTGPSWMIILLIIGLFISALGLVYVRYVSRQGFIQSQHLHEQIQTALIEQGKLFLEKGAISNPGRISSLVKTHLTMHAPASSEIVIVKEGSEA